MRQIVEFIWNAPAWQLLGMMGVIIGVPAVFVCGLMLHTNRIHAKAISEFEQRKKETQDRKNRGVRRTG